MKLIKEYLCDNRTPTDEEIKMGIETTNTEECIVKLVWFFPYNGWHQLLIHKGMTFNECKDKLPKVYGI